MKTINDTITVDLNKVSYCVFYYRNNKSSTRLIKPEIPTVEGSTVDNSFALPHHDYPHETLIERARRLDILDTWTPVIRLQLSNSHKLEFTGIKALKLRELWLKKLYGNTTRDKRTNNTRKDKGEKKINRPTQTTFAI